MADASDPFGGLNGADRDAAVALTNLFKSYGLDSLAPKVLDFIRQGYSGDTVAILLQETPEYKQRFAANDARVKAGLPALSPAEYLATERSYRQIMASAGLPVGFYDSPDDFKSWLEGDVSPTEVQQRVNDAVELVNSVDQETRDFFTQHYTQGDLVAYALDRKRAEPLIQKQIAAARIGGAAASQGLNIGSDRAEQLATAGITGQQASSGFGFIQQNLDATERLAAISGTEFSQEDLENEVFLDNAESSDKRKKLASQERARFGGSGGQSRTSLSSSNAGAF